MERIGKFLDKTIFNRFFYKIALLICCFGITFFYFSYWLDEEKWISLIFCLSIVLLFVDFLKGEYKIEHLKKSGLIILIPLFGVMLFSTIYTLLVNNVCGPTAMRTLMIHFITFFILFYNDKSYTKEKIEFEKIIVSHIYIIITFILSVWTLYSVFTRTSIIIGGNLIYNPSIYTAGLYMNTSTSALFSVSSLLLSCVYIKKIKINIINILIQFIVFFMADCRGTMLFFFILIIYIISKKIDLKKIKLRKLMIATIGIILFIVGFFLLLRNVVHVNFGRNYETIIKTMVEYTNSDDLSFFGKVEYILNRISSDRYFIWKDAIMCFLYSPIFGKGLSTMEIFPKMVLDLNHMLVQHPYSNAHNLFVNALYFTGIIGLILIVWLLKYIYKILKKYISLDSSWEAKCTIVFICFVIFMSITTDVTFLFSIRAFDTICWIYIGYIVRTVLINEEALHGVE